MAFFVSDEVTFVVVLLVGGDAADLRLIGTAGLRSVCAITALLERAGGGSPDVSGVVQGSGR